MSFQGEYAAQVLGLSAEGAREEAAGSPRPTSRPLYPLDAPAPAPASPYRKDDKEHNNHVNNKFNNNVSSACSLLVSIKEE